MADTKQPQIWVGFALDDVPFTAVQTFRYSHRPLAAAVFIEGRIPADGWGDMVRRSSSLSGEPAVDSLSVTFRDNDNHFRALLSTDNNYRFFRGRAVSVEMLSETALAAAGVPAPGEALGRILMIGTIQDFQVQDNLTAVMNVEDVLSRYLDKKYPQYTFNQAYPYLFEDVLIDEDLDITDPGVQMPSQLRDQVIPIYYGPFVDLAQHPITGAARQKGYIKTWFMGFTHLDAGSAATFEPPSEQQITAMTPFQNSAAWNGWGELVVGLGEYDIPNVYTSDLDIESPRRRLNTADYGVTILAPGHPGWPFATDYVMRNGYRLTVIYARGPLLWQHITNEVNITVDLCGWKSPLSPFNAITQAGYVWQDFIIQHVLANGGEGYTSGPSIATVPTYGVGDRTMLWTQKIEEWQEMTKDRLGNDVGYLASMALTQATPLREILATFNRTFNCHNAKNGAGQHYIYSINDIASLTVGTPIRERIELKRLPAPRIGWNEVRNVFNWNYGWDPEQDAPASVTYNTETPLSIQQQNERIPEGSTISFPYTHDNATAMDSFARYARRVNEPPHYQDLVVDIGGVDINIGDPVLVSHRHGLGPEGVGYNAQHMTVMGVVQRKHEIILECLDDKRLIEKGLNNAVSSGGGGWGWGLWQV